MARLARMGAVLAAAAIFAAACGGGAATPSTTTTTTITATLTDTAIALSETAIPAGKVTFQVTNKGTVLHQLVLLKTDLPHDKIPADAKDASRASETGSLASTGSFGVGGTKTFTRDLASGNYVLICNEPAHYIVGMHLGLVVK